MLVPHLPATLAYRIGCPLPAAHPMPQLTPPAALCAYGPAVLPLLLAPPSTVGPTHLLPIVTQPAPYCPPVASADPVSCPLCLHPASADPELRPPPAY